ncbi:serine/threonine protein kinase [Nonomuraea fuscirosea]|uniref:serine/threonine-protein kinase n=1 Tax=Nonomuraea fuscirosea TaxID=1291556 RepID=UPI002DDB496B|nr:serine/threonine-protein kinase [Nonomuraea fuscirosea]WSA49984.1 serine/threonine protein kinase [Nonomuraea fuscirosea]
MQDLPVPNPEGPAHVSGYHLVRRLGEGGQGAVFLGESPGGRQVAIKILHSCFAADSHVRERFRREAEIAQRLATFSTARVLETGFTQERPYIISEYVPGPSLERLVKEGGPRSGGGLERLAVTTLTALTSIHAAGIVHRDFKPSNVIMGQEGPVVIDFGIAFALDATAGSTEPAGTPAYMAPEQLDDQPLTPASDMFSWAGTIVFAATGRPAFAGGTVPATLNAVLHAEPDLSGLPDELRHLVAACLAKNPASRPAAVDLLCDLVGGDRGPSSAVSDTAPARDVRPASRHRHRQQRHQHRNLHRPVDRPEHRAAGDSGRGRAEGRHAASPASATPAPAAPASSRADRRRRGAAIVAAGTAVVATAGTLLFSSVSGSPADAQDRWTRGSATPPACVTGDPAAHPLPQPSAPPDPASAGCAEETGGQGDPVPWAP